MALLDNNKGYKWNFENIGGTTRVKITTGEDLMHLAELDPKMWTVLSCPLKGLEIDEKSLSFMDCDGDGKLRVNDVICTSKWVTGALKDADLLLEGKDSIDIENINREDACGSKLYAAAKQVLMNLGKEGTVISLTDIADSSAIFAKTRFNGDGVIIEASAEGAEDKAAIAAAVAVTGGTLDRSGVQGVTAAQVEEFYKALADYAAWKEAEVEAPYGDQTDKAIELYNALDAKVKDFFVRSRLAAFSPDSTSSLDVQTAQIQAISAENLTGKTADIAAYPIARVDGKDRIDLSAPVNPAWAAQFEALRKIAVDPEAEVLTEDDWNAIGARFAAYSAWKSAKAGAGVEALGLDAVKNFIAQDRKAAILDLVAQDAALSEEAANIAMVDKFLHVFRDFYRLVRNFVTFHDFYDKKKETLAIFQSGVLMIDQRACRFCMNVADMAKHNSMAASSGMYLVYCDCTTKTVAGKIQIVAAVTVGEVGDLMVGKNAIYYDNKGLEWDAVITKIVDNPISIAQAFWSPYRRMATAVENLISKNAADKDAKIMKEATTKINAAPSSIPSGGTALSPETDKKMGEAFDIGKFAGIFAALGMAVGMIGSALVSLAKGIVALKWWQVIMAFVGVMLVISGPAMVMAWLKLRRRNIAPLLNANGWAINVSSKISILFGETLTDIAKYPKLKLKDPYARKGLAPWKKWVISLSAVVVVAAGLWLGNLLSWAGLPSPLPWFNKTEVVVDEVVVEEVAVTDSTVVTEQAL
ncbi:MAG: hypothetical protein IKB85_06550 [Bacteroidales bacterium]|nr:hypothetical protein [Bacteroidales bacterium]